MHGRSMGMGGANRGLALPGKRRSATAPPAPPGGVACSGEADRGGDSTNSTTASEAPSPQGEGAPREGHRPRGGAKRLRGRPYGAASSGGHRQVWHVAFWRTTRCWGPIRAIYERRIAKFEAHGVWAALKVLDSWAAYRQECMGSGSELEMVVALTNFVEEQQAATGPLSTWNKLDWVRRHLKIEFPLHEVPKPSRKAAEDTGVVAEVEQAVSIPPEYLVAFEECLRRMVIADDWRRVALAAGLEVAYSLVRVIHMNRSGFLTQSKLVCAGSRPFAGKARGRAHGNPSSGRWSDMGSPAWILPMSSSRLGMRGPGTAGSR